MNSTQKSAVLALGLLLAIAIVGFALGPNRAKPEDGNPSIPLLDIASLDAVELLPPERREYWIAPRHFRERPVRHPLEGGVGRDIAEWRRDPADDELLDAPAKQARGGARPHPTEASYRVREDDNLQKIAKAQLGDKDRWKELADYNGLREPYVIGIGDLLLLPPATASPEAGAPEAPAAAPRSSTPQEEDGQGQAAAGWRTYKVQQNEVPGQVSEKMYGTSREWKRILEANDLKRPQDMRAGMTLKIPPLED